MWRPLRRGIILVLVGVAVSGGSMVLAQFRGQPPIVRFTGVFEPFEKKSAGDLNTLTLTYKEKQWLFKVDQLKAMGAGRDTGMLLLSRIVPPRLSLSGPAQLLEPLGNSESMGRRWTLEGMLYLRQRRYYVAIVEILPAEEK